MSQRPAPFSSRFLQTRLWVVLLLLGVSAGVILSLADVGPETDPPVRDGDETFSEYTKVELTLIEAVVLDRRGRHVRGLPLTSFELFEGREQLEILTFDEIDLSDRGSTVAAFPQAAAADTTEPAGEAPRGPGAELSELGRSRVAEPRWFIMLFDGYNNISPLRMVSMRRAAKKWVKTNMRDRDMVAVFEMIPFMSTIVGFTDQIARIEDAIDRTRIFPASSMGLDMIDQRLEQGQALPREFLEQQLLNAAKFGGGLLNAERNQFYVNIGDIARVLREFDGTKAVLLFSGGFSMTRTRETAARGGFTTRFTDMLSLLEEGGVRVFSYDIGEEGGFTGADQSTNFRLQLDQLGFGTEWLDTLQVGAQIDALNANHEILAVLGNETGGRFWRSRNYYDGLQAADDDLSHYYLIGFAPAKEAPQKKYSKVKLRVEGAGLRVITRGGRFARSPPGEDPPDPASAGTRAAVDVVEPSVEAAPPLEAEPIVVHCRPMYYPATGGRTLVVLPIRVTGPVATVAVGPTKRVLDFDLTVSAAVDGKDAGHGTRTVRLELLADNAWMVGSGVQIREAILLAPGVADLRVDFRLNGLDRSGSWEIRQRIPGRRTETFGLTELALLDPVDRTPLVYDVFLAEDHVFGTEPPAALVDPLGEEAAGRPQLYLEGGLSRRVPLLAQIQVITPPRPTEDQERPMRMDWELLPAGGGEALAPPVRYRRMEMRDGDALLDVLVDLDLGAVEPGEYTLRLTAENLVTPGKAVRSRPITVVP